MTGGLVIVGASLSGLRTAEAARQAGFSGSITLIGAEGHLPYNRPPLSKEFLTRELPTEDLFLRSAEDLSRLGVDLRLGSPATGLDLADRIVHVGGNAMPFGTLVIATGARARTLAVSAPSGVHTLRTLDDSLAVRDALTSVQSVAVVGAGFVGLEVAAAARRLGKEVHVVEALDVPLERIVGRTVGRLLGELHREQGVTVLTGDVVTSFRGSPAVNGLQLRGGSVLPADIVIIGIGTVPNTEWLDGSGLSLEPGVRCDTSGAATGATDVFAVGDVARWRAPGGDKHRGYEHWANAVGQAQIVGKRIADPDRPLPDQPVPFFWSDQFGHKIQMVGAIDGVPADVELSPDTGFREPSVALLRDGHRLGAAITVDWPRMTAVCRRMISAGESWDGAVALIRGR
jgi:NADPH-dependent 2,4-dienoyl-CoA reductase/sulfur reductase-like enzyme